VTNAARGGPALLLDRLSEPGPLVTVELRPPLSQLEASDGMGEWIDLHHSLGSLTRDELFVFLTDNAVGAAEEENLAHVGANVDEDVDLRRIVPILTTKHSLEYCEMFASRAASEGFDALTVLGGDPTVGPSRCLPHGRDLREKLRQRIPELALGGWANPHRPAAEQVGFLSGPDAHADFVLTQVVSHHSTAMVSAFMDELSGRALHVPVVYGVFFYRSANPRTLSVLNDFFPVPVTELTRDFESGLSAEEICARSIRELRAAGAEKVYVSNLGNRGAGRRLRRILDEV
jgi:5,10-methylenetetrahydrofolate reductase